MGGGILPPPPSAGGNKIAPPPSSNVKASPVASPAHRPTTGNTEWGDFESAA